MLLGFLRDYRQATNVISDVDLPPLCVAAQPSPQPFWQCSFHRVPLVPSSLVGDVPYKVTEDRLTLTASTFGPWGPLAFA